MSDEFVQRKLAGLEKKRSTVVFAHGCRGLGRGNLRYMRLLAEEGYAVIAPDSFARRYRPETCDPSRRRGIKGAPHRRVNQMRQEEIHHADYRLRRIRWVDRKNLFLMGHSQGGTAVAAYEGDGFKAHVISGSVCWRGVRSPRETPILALYSEDDPWRRNRPADSCLRRARRRGVNMEFHLFEGRAHNLSRNKRARRLILDFLNRHRRAE
ncbi:MAG: dienelactone hydrolase family protein [Nitrospinae bacterium]|nr:dienelactone hydrolase family protein [Nitrospinota bacterium]